jgi:CRISPR/Cas system-associated exonuclease Cas4 (RecB family)
MSDSNFPGTHITDSSSIPYSLRYGYNLPTQEHHQGVFAYYFYRLISRADRVWLAYCSTADEKGSGEPSRYIRQLQYESGIKVDVEKVSVEVNVLRQSDIEVPKCSQTMERLARFTSGERRMSPTAFSSYVQCPMRFYYRYVAGIKVEEPLEEGIDDKTFGNIFHRAAELLYEPIVGRENAAAEIAKITQQQVLSAVEQAIAEECFDTKEVDSERIRGELAIIRQIVFRYISDNLFSYDTSHGSFSVVATEDVFDTPFEFEVAGERQSIIFEGRADRVDSLPNGMRRIVDYKTGGEHLTFPGFEKLFYGKDAQRISNTINTLLYAMIMQRRRGCEVQPALYYLRDMIRDDYSPLLRVYGASRKAEPIECYSAVAEEFESYVSRTLSELFNPAVPFKQSDDLLSCTYCDYAPICQRRKR